MSFNLGPKTITTDLSIYYDVTNVKSYPGEPTQNLLDGVNYNISVALYNPGIIDGSVIISQTPSYFYILRDGSIDNNRFGVKTVIDDVFNYISDVSGKTIYQTFDYRVLSTDNSAYVSLGYSDCRSAADVYDFNRGTVNFYLKDKNLGQWYSYNSSWNASVEYATISNYFWIEDGNGEIEIRNHQIEVKDHPTPFTPTRRDSSAGLKDLVGGYNIINLNNCSFDSNAQISFDGTDDFIAHPDLSFDSSSAWAFTQWQYIPTDFSGPWQVFAGTNNGTTTGGYWMWHNNNILRWYQDYYDDGSGYLYYGSMYTIDGFNVSINENNLGKWNNITISYNPDTVECTAMLNGTEMVDTKPITWSPIPINHFTFRNLGMSGGGRYFYGKIGLYQVWAKQISIDENILNYNNLKSKFK